MIWRHLPKTENKVTKQIKYMESKANIWHASNNNTTQRLLAIGADSLTVFKSEIKRQRSEY